MVGSQVSKKIDTKIGSGLGSSLRFCLRFMSRLGSKSSFRVTELLIEIGMAKIIHITLNLSLLLGVAKACKRFW